MFLIGLFSLSPEAEGNEGQVSRIEAVREGNFRDTDDRAQPSSLSFPWEVRFTSVFLAIDKSNTHLILSYKREADLAGTIGTAPSPGNWECYYVLWPSNPLIHSLLPLIRMEVDIGGQGPFLLAECFSLRFHLLKKKF